MSNFYEERATMIAAGDLQEFVPFGRDHCKHHPNALNLQLRQLQPASELWSSDGAAGLIFLKCRMLRSTCNLDYLPLRKEYNGISRVVVKIW